MLFLQTSIDSPTLGIAGCVVLTDSPRLGIVGCVVLTDLH